MIQTVWKLLHLRIPYEITATKYPHVCIFFVAVLTNFRITANVAEINQ